MTSISSITTTTRRRAIVRLACLTAVGAAVLTGPVIAAWVAAQRSIAEAASAQLRGALAEVEGLAERRRRAFRLDDSVALLEQVFVAARSPAEATVAAAERVSSSARGAGLRLTELQATAPSVHAGMARVVIRASAVLPEVGVGALVRMLANAQPPLTVTSFKIAANAMSSDGAAYRVDLTVTTPAVIKERE